MTKFEDPFMWTTKEKNQNHQARILVVAKFLTKPGQHEGEID